MEPTAIIERKNTLIKKTTDIIIVAEALLCRAKARVNCDSWVLTIFLTSAKYKDSFKDSGATCPKVPTLRAAADAKETTERAYGKGRAGGKFLWIWDFGREAGMGT